MLLDLIDKKIISAMQDDLPLVPEPYRQLAEKAGIGQEEFLTRLSRLQSAGALRKMAAVVRHRQVGYMANALCAWVVPADRLDEVGELMAKHSAVTHCYSRKTYDHWPYSLYTMLHTHTREECHVLAKNLGQAAGVEQYIMLYSTKEWKKTSMRYFKEVEG